MMVTLFEFVYAPIEVSHILMHTICFYLVNFVFQVLRGRWCHIFALNVDAPCEEERAEVKDRFFGEKGRVFDQFPRYDIKIILGHFCAKVGMENIFKPTIGIESLH
jgi:hypothetical protein